MGGRYCHSRHTSYARVTLLSQACARSRFPLSHVELAVRADGPESWTWSERERWDRRVSTGRIPSFHQLHLQSATRHASEWLVLSALGIRIPEFKRHATYSMRYRSMGTIAPLRTTPRRRPFGQPHRSLRGRCTTLGITASSMDHAARTHEARKPLYTNAHYWLPRAPPGVHALTSSWHLAACGRSRVEGVALPCA